MSSVPLRKPPDSFVPGVHAARAVAVVMVILAHIIGLWTATQNGVKWLPWSAYLRVVVDTPHLDHQGGGHVGLLLFFLVSGFIVSQAAEREDRITFAVKRAARLLPAMIVAVAFGVAVGTLGQERGWYPMYGYIQDRAHSPWIVLEAIGFGLLFGGLASLFVLWSLHVEYAWYVLLGLCIPFARSRPVLTTALMTAGAASLGIFCRDWSWGVLHPNIPLAPYLLVILLGRWIYLWHTGRLGLWMTVGTGLVVLGLYTLAQENFLGSDAYSGRYPRVLAATYATVGFLALLRFVRTGPWKPVAFVADISYGLYLFHLPVMWLVLPIVSPGGTRLTLGFLTTAIALVAVAWTVERFVERPVRRGARHALARRRGRQGVNTVAVPSV